MGLFRSQWLIQVHIPQTALRVWCLLLLQQHLKTPRPVVGGNPHHTAPRVTTGRNQQLDLSEWEKGQGDPELGHTEQQRGWVWVARIEVDHLGTYLRGVAGRRWFWID
jgi:hypothetical protein